MLHRSLYFTRQFIKSSPTLKYNLINRSFSTSTNQGPNFFYRHRYTILYGAVISSLLTAIQLDVHRKIRFQSIPFFLSLSSSNNKIIKKFGVYSMFRLSRDYETSIKMGNRGVLNILADIIDKELTNEECIDSILFYSYASLNNLAHYSPNKIKLISQDWLKRYKETTKYISECDDKYLDSNLICFSCFLASLSTYSKIESSTSLAYGGICNWIQKLLSIRPLINKPPKKVKLLLRDQLQQSFSSPSILINNISSLGISSPGTCYPPYGTYDYVLGFLLVTIGELSRHRFSRNKLIDDGIISILDMEKKHIIDDPFLKPLYLRALAFVAKNDVAKEEIIEFTLPHFIEWSKETDRQILLFSNSLLYVLLENKEIGKRLVKVLGKTSINKSLQNIDVSVPLYLENINIKE